MAEPIYNPLDPSFRADPYPAYERLRNEDPVHETPAGAFVISRYEDCAGLLRHPDASSDLRYAQAVRKSPPAAARAALVRAPPFLLLDPPDHTRLRGLVAKAFTPRVIEAHRPIIQTLVDDLLDRLADQGTGDLIETVAYPLPVTVICQLLGVPPEDYETFKRWSGDLARAQDPEELLPPEAIEARDSAARDFSAYFHDLIDVRRSRPGDDLLSALIAAEQAGDKLSEDELMSNCIFLLAAGHETTVNLIANGTLALLRSPLQLGALRDDPAIASSAVEEFLRFDAPVQVAGRIAREDIYVRDRVIPSGRQIAILIGAANRDGKRFLQADVLDLKRPDNHHLAFGGGPHYCLGAPLARLEGEVFFATLGRRFEVELLTGALEYKPNIVNRGLQTLPVRLTTLAGRP